VGTSSRETRLAPEGAPIRRALEADLVDLAFSRGGNP